MRPFPLLALPLPFLFLFAAATAGADPPDPDPSAALLAGTATSVVGIIAGSSIMAAGDRREFAENAGWLTMCGAFTLTPVVAHAVEGEWVRGLVFASAPAVAMGGTGALFAVVPNAVDHGAIDEQRVMWALFGLSVFGAAAGIVDATLAPRRAREREVVVAPIAGAGQLGLQIAGRL
jgi:hypothetical protein